MKKSDAESTPFETLVKAKVTVSRRKRRLNVCRLRNTNRKEVYYVSQEEHA